MSDIAAILGAATAQFKPLRELKPIDVAEWKLPDGESVRLWFPQAMNGSEFDALQKAASEGEQAMYITALIQFARKESGERIFNGAQREMLMLEVDFQIIKKTVKRSGILDSIDPDSDTSKKE